MNNYSNVDFDEICQLNDKDFVNYMIKTLPEVGESEQEKNFRDKLWRHKLANTKLYGNLEAIIEGIKNPSQELSPFLGKIIYNCYSQHAHIEGFKKPANTNKIILLLSQQIKQIEAKEPYHYRIVDYNNLIRHITKASEIDVNTFKIPNISDLISTSDFVKDRLKAKNYDDIFDMIKLGLGDLDATKNALEQIYQDNPDNARLVDAAITIEKKYNTESPILLEAIRKRFQQQDEIQTESFENNWDELNKHELNFKARSIYGQSQNYVNSQRIRLLEKFYPNNRSDKLDRIAAREIIKLDNSAISLEFIDKYLHESKIKLSVFLKIMAKYPEIEEKYHDIIDNIHADKIYDIQYEDNRTYHLDDEELLEAPDVDATEEKSGEIDIKYDNVVGEIFQAMRNNAPAREKYELLLRKTAGDRVADLYMTYHDEIDHAPKFALLTKRIPELESRKELSFMSAFRNRLTEIAANDFGENDYWRWCENLKDNPNFIEKANIVFDEMLANKENYINTIGESNGFEDANYFISKDKIQKVKQSLFITAADIEKELAFARAIRTNEKAIKEYEVSTKDNDNAISLPSNRASFDMAVAGINTYAQAKEAAEIFIKVNKRPEIYGSSYNIYNFNKIAPLLGRGLEEWMVPLIMSNTMINPARLGGKKELFDACKTWNISPYIWKKEAVQIGKMPLLTRVVAGAIADKMYQETTLDWKHDKSLRNDFWIKMKDAQDMGITKALETYAQSNIETRGRIISALHESLPENITKTLREKCNIQDIIHLDTAAFEKNLTLLSGHCERNLIEDNNCNLLLDTMNAQHVFGDKFEDYLQKTYLTEPSQILSWMPRDLSEEKYNHYAKFIDKNLFYKDDEGNEVMRSYEQLKSISNIWQDLTPQQEEMSFERLIGLSYTSESKKNIEQSFQNFLISYQEKSVGKKKKTKRRLDSLPLANDVYISAGIPEDLQLWQKFAIASTFKNTSSEIAPHVIGEKIEEIINGNRTEVLANLNLDEEEKRILTDIIIGNRHDINPLERNEINHLPINNIVNFNPSVYQKTMNELVNREIKDPEASKLFCKNYINITSEQSNVRSEKIKTLQNVYMEHRNWMIPSAIALNDVFGNDYKNYLNKIDLHNKHVVIQINKQAKIGGEETYSAQNMLNIHDAVYWLPKKLSQENKKSFVEFVNKQFFYADVNGNKYFRSPGEMEIISKNWDSIDKEDQTLGFKDILAKCRSKKYADQKYVDFAEEAAKFGIDTGAYKRLENIYAAGLNTSTPFDTKPIFEKDGLKGRFLPRSDPRVGFFGNYTSCCQHFDGVGNKCAISSIKDPFSQLFVIENSKSEIIAGSWTWTNKVKKQDEQGNEAMFKTATFDNVEAKLSYNEQSKKIKDIYKIAAQYLAEQNFRMITIGTSGSDIDLRDLSSINSIPMHPSYSGYSDASQQVLLLENPNAKPLPENVSDLIITGASQDDLTLIQGISDKCFPEGDRAIQFPDEPQAMLLIDGCKTVGYIIWTESEDSTNSKGEKISNWIYDMAVLPEYRKGSKAGSALLLNEMMRHVKDVGGEWGAELRDTTSLRYMRAMAGRNVVKMEELGTDHKMSDGSEVVEVKFSYIPEKEREVPQKNKITFMDKLKKTLQYNH